MVLSFGATEPELVISPLIKPLAKSDEVQLIINSSEEVQSIEDSFSIRQLALIGNIPHYTTVTGAATAIEALITMQCSGGLEVASLQSYFRGSS